MAQLEYISIAGFLFVLMLLFTMVVEACKAGLPAIGDGEFSIVGFTDLCAPSPAGPSLTRMATSSFVVFAALHTASTCTLLAKVMGLSSLLRGDLQHHHVTWAVAGQPAHSLINATEGCGVCAPSLVRGNC